MKKQNTLLAYILIGIGVFFLFRKLRLPIFTDFYSWQTLLIIVGAAILIHSYRTTNYENILMGGIVLGVGIHLHGQANYHFWINHWAVYLIIVGASYLLRYVKTKSGLLLSIILLGLGFFLIYSGSFGLYFDWISDLVNLIEKYWPVLLIILGFFLLRKGK